MCIRDRCCYPTNVAKDLCNKIYSFNLSAYGAYGIIHMSLLFVLSLLLNKNVLHNASKIFTENGKKTSNVEIGSIGKYPKFLAFFIVNIINGRDFIIFARSDSFMCHIYIP